MFTIIARLHYIYLYLIVLVIYFSPSLQQHVSLDDLPVECSSYGVYDRVSRRCTCDQCRSGTACQTPVVSDNCTLYASSGNPLLYLDYWSSRVEAILPPLTPYWRMGHDVDGRDKRFPMPELETAIRELHATVGHADVDGEIIVGVGSTQLVHASLYAIVKRYGGDDGVVNVTSSTLFYGEHKSIAEFTPGVAWTSPTTNCREIQIEILTVPNNPDGRLPSPRCPHSRVIYDHAYLWPHYTTATNDAPLAKSDVKLFTLTKLTGHAGSRVGWAVVSDPALAGYVRDYVDIIGHGVSHESQLRASVVLKDVAKGDMFEWARTVLEDRWGRVEDLWASQKRFGMTTRLEGTTPPYLWMECLLPEDLEGSGSCYEFLRDSGIVGRDGALFGGDKSWVRLTLLLRPSEFEILMQKLSALIQDHLSFRID